MSIVRSLLVSIGFKTDKKAIADTNKAITGFKTRFALVSSTALYAFKTIKDFFSDIATATLDADELARSLGISLNELTALQQAAQKFRIKDEQLAGAFGILQKDLHEFMQGFGRLPEIARQLRIEIGRDTGVVDLFNKIVEKIREVENEQERIRIASNIFSKEIGVGISDLSRDFDNFKNSVSEAYRVLEATPTNINALREYERAVNDLDNSFTSLYRSFVSIAAPALTNQLRHLSDIFSFIGGGINQTVDNLRSMYELLKGLAGIVSTFFSAFDSAFENFSAPFMNWLRPFVENQNGMQGNLQTTPSSYGPSWIESQLPPNWINYINNSVAINVPQGTTAEQTTYIGNEIERMIEDSIMNTFYQIQANNPVVE